MKKMVYKTCFYCGALISGEGKGDHFPIPKRNGGKEIVLCCLSCHDMKDRFSLDKWPVEWLNKFFQDFHKCSLETKILFTKAGDMAFFRIPPMETREYKKCFCCGALLTQSQKLGTVPYCESCREIKDCILTDEWPTKWVSKVIDDFPEFSRETKILWAKILSTYSDLIEEHKKDKRASYLF